MSDVSTRPTSPATESPMPQTGTGPTPLWRSLGVAGAVAMRIYPLVALVGVWQLLVVLEVVSPFTLPAPLATWDAAVAAWQAGTLPDDIRVTFSRVLTAWVLAVVVGVAVGVLIGRLRSVRQTARPLVRFFFPTPKVAIYPALVIIFGLGTASKIALGFAEAVFPVILATSAAASAVDPRLLWSAQAFGTSRSSTLVRIILPASLPGIMTGARIGLVGSIIGVFMGELIVGSQGLGRAMSLAYRTLETADMYVAVVAMSAIGFVLDRLFLMARGRLLGWSAEGDR